MHFKWNYSLFDHRKRFNSRIVLEGMTNKHITTIFLPFSKIAFIHKIDTRYGLLQVWSIKSISWHGIRVELLPNLITQCWATIFKKICPCFNVQPWMGRGDWRVPTSRIYRTGGLFEWFGQSSPVELVFGGQLGLRSSSLQNTKPTQTQTHMLWSMYKARWLQFLKDGKMVFGR